MMKRQLGLLTLGILGLTAVSGHADQASFAEGPVFTPREKILIVSGALAQLQDKDAVVIVDARGTARVVCRDADGKVVGRGRQVPATVRFEDHIPVAMIAAGHAAFFLMSGELALDRKAASCGNPRWTPRVENVKFQSAIVTVTQGGVTILIREFPL
jgi:hypothetical protein